MPPGSKPPRPINKNKQLNESPQLARTRERFLTAEAVDPDQVRDAILDGRLRAGERVPPSRDLARSLAVSRNTVAAAYDRLVRQRSQTA